MIGAVEDLDGPVDLHLGRSRHGADVTRVAPRRARRRRLALALAFAFARGGSVVENRRLLLGLGLGRLALPVQHAAQPPDEGAPLRRAHARGRDVVLRGLADPALVIGAGDAELADGLAAPTGREKRLRALAFEDRAPADVAGDRLLVGLQLFFGRGPHPRSRLARRSQPLIPSLQRSLPAAPDAPEPPRSEPRPSCNRPARP